MASAYDLSGIGDFTNYGGIGVAQTPGLFNTSGASNPTGAYFQSPDSASIGSFPAAPVSSPLGGDLLGPTGSSQGGGFFGSGGGGFGLDGLKLVLGGLSTIGNIWTAWNANKLAKDQLKFQKGLANANLTNQISSYNTSLEDRIRSRMVQQNGTQGQADQYIAAHKLAPVQL